MHPGSDGSVGFQLEKDASEDRQLLHKRFFGADRSPRGAWDRCKFDLPTASLEEIGHRDGPEETIG